jgi:hypothetical protein
VANRLLSDIKELLRPESAPNRAIPTLDGGLTPNDRLDEFTSVTALEDVEDVVAESDKAVLVTAGNALWRIDLTSGRKSLVAELPGKGLGLARDGDGVLVCVGGAGLIRVSSDGGLEPLVVQTGAAGDGDLMSVVVMGDDLYVTRCSTTNPAQEWARDLMSKGSTGALLKVLPGGGLEAVVDNLAWAYGACVVGEEILFAESWAHRILAYAPATGKTRTVRDRLPGYPARLHESGASVWVALLALRTYLVEFVLRETRFRERMIAEIPVKDWIRPALTTTNTVREPLQLGGVRHLGETKPWAPPRSYGLVGEMDASGDFVRSFHSRPGKHRHGTVAALAQGDSLIVLAAGSGDVLIGSTSMERKHA